MPPRAPCRRHNFAIELITLERRERDARNRAARTKAAALGTPKPLHRFDGSHPRAIECSKRNCTTRSVSSSPARTCCCVDGGRRKNYAREAPRLRRPRAKGRSVRFTTLAGALADFLGQHTLPAVERRLRRYTAPDLLICDKAWLRALRLRCCRPALPDCHRETRTALGRDHHQPRLQAMGHRLRGRAVPRHSSTASPNTTTS
jgi:hypothetical protein